MTRRELQESVLQFCEQVRQPPHPTDPSQYRLCNRCGTIRGWQWARCLCGGVEFQVIPDPHEGQEQSHDPK